MKTKLHRMMLLMTTVALLAACKTQDTLTDNVELNFEASTSAISRYAVNANVTFTEFKISVQQIEFKADSTSAGSGERIFVGPYVIDLLNSNGVLSQALGTTQVPAGNYKAIVMKLYKNTSVAANHVLYNRSMYLAGTVNGKQFVMYHDPSDELLVTNTNGISISDKLVHKIVARFNLGSILNNTSYTIDLTTAVDSNADNLIDISPNSADTANRSMADNMKNSIKTIADFYEK